jgi:hypothetical protein
MIEIEVTTEIWRTEDCTFVVMYPFPNVAYIKGLRGVYTRKLGLEIKRLLEERGVTLVQYERRKDGKNYIVSREAGQ